MKAPLSVLFDYTALPADVGAEAKAAAASIKEHMRGAIIDVGIDLIRIKDRLPHGEFGKWLKAEFRMTKRSAQRYMSAAALARKCDTVSDLRPKTIYLLAAPSTPQPVQQVVLDRLNNGERIEDETICEMVAEAKFQEQQAQREAEIAAREAKLSPPRTGRSRAQREAEREQQRRDMAAAEEAMEAAAEEAIEAAAEEAMEAAARKAAEIIIPRLQPDDRKKLTALIGDAAKNLSHGYRFHADFVRALSSALERGSDDSAPKASSQAAFWGAQADSILTPEKPALAEPEPEPPIANQTASAARSKGWYGIKPPCPCNSKDGICNYSGCQRIGCCGAAQFSPKAVGHERAS